MENNYEKYKRSIQQLLYEGLIGDSDPGIPSDEYSPEAKLLLEWLSKRKDQKQAINANSVADKLAEIFSRIFGEPYEASEFKDIAESIKASAEA